MPFSGLRFWRRPRAEPLTRLVWLSRARLPQDAATLRRSSASFAARNAVLGLSGLLVRVDDLYLQVLEGAGPVLGDVLKRIGADARHHQLRVLHQQPAGQRLFAPWSLGLLDLSAPNPLAAADCARLFDFVQQSAQRAETAAAAPVEAVLRSMPLLLRRCRAHPAH